MGSMLVVHASMPLSGLKELGSLWIAGLKNEGVCALAMTVDAVLLVKATVARSVCTWGRQYVRSTCQAAAIDGLQAKAASCLYTCNHAAPIINALVRISSCRIQQVYLLLCFEPTLNSV